MFYYVFDKNGRIIAKCGYEPSKEDIQQRDEDFIRTDESVDILKYKIVDRKLVKK